MKLIRKITIGKDYKNDAMHYAVGQEVYGGHTICDIIEEEDLMTLSTELEQLIRKHLDISGIVAIRGKGAWLGVELNQPAKPIIRSLLEDGVFVGGSGHPNTIRVSPPAKMPESGVQQLRESLQKALNHIQSGVA